MQPTVSVIMPTYNRAKYLKKAIKSVLNQTFLDFEIIVINNFSTDETLDVVQSFNDNRIKIINFNNDGIIAKSRNKGILHSTGKYIAFLDDDDLWCFNKLELQIQYLELNKEFDLVYSRAVIIDEFDNKQGLLIDPEDSKTGYIFKELLHNNFISILTVLVKKSVFDEVGLFNEEYNARAAEDYELWLRIAINSKFGFINNTLALYRMHSSNVSSSINKPLLRQKILHNIITNSVIPKEYIAEVDYNIQRLNSDISVFYWKTSDKSDAREYAKKYTLLNLKKFRIFNAIAGVILYVAVNFNYQLFDKFVKIIAKKRKIVEL